VVPFAAFQALLASAVLSAPLGSQELPAWWRSFSRAPRLESAFVQSSESAVFGKLTRKGRLQVARGGFLRVAYERGILLVGDGRDLIQYDPGARTAQKLDLRAAAREMPLVNVLLDPEALGQAYRVRAEGARVLLEPRRKGLPAVALEGQGSLLKRLSWTDPTGAKQVLELTDPRVPATFSAPDYRFQAPAGTRWIEP